MDMLIEMNKHEIKGGSRNSASKNSASNQRVKKKQRVQKTARLFTIEVLLFSIIYFQNLSHVLSIMPQ